MIAGICIFVGVLFIVLAGPAVALGLSALDKASKLADEKLPRIELDGDDE